jgi:hypothetical protein
MRTIYMKDFLRLPTATDLKNIVKLHKVVTRSDRFRELNDLVENRRLHMALMS